MNEGDARLFCSDQQENVYERNNNNNYNNNTYNVYIPSDRHGTQNMSNEEEESEDLSKMIAVSSELNILNQVEEEDNDGETSPLGLKLTITPSLLNSLGKKLSEINQQTDNNNNSNNKNDNYHHHQHSPTTLISNSQATPQIREKLKASNFPATSIRIGSWQRITKHEGDLVAKLYYAKRKLVWEFLGGPLKSKIEIQWSDIIGIRAIFSENKPAILDIELNQPPLFYKESQPQPRRHTVWFSSSDFTSGQALIFRRHYLVFPPGILDKHYEKLLQCDQRLFALSQKPFPSKDCPYFDSYMLETSPFHLHAYPPQRLHFSYHTNPVIPSGTSSSIATMSNQFSLQNQTTFGGSNYNTDLSRSNNRGFSVPNYHHHHHHHHQSYSGTLSDIANHLLGSSNVCSYDDANSGDDQAMMPPSQVMNSSLIHPFMFDGGGNPTI